MKFEKSTLGIFSNFASINPSIQVKPGNKIRTVNKGKTVFAEAFLDVSFDKEFCILDLGRFLSTLSLFTDPEVIIHEGHLELREGTNVIKYATATASTILIPKDNVIDFGQAFVTFDLPQEVIAKAIKAASILKVEYIAVLSKDGKIVVQAYDNNGLLADTFEQEIGDTDKEFSIIYNISNLQILPLSYTVNIHRVQGADGPLPVAILNSKDATKIKYIIGLEKTSKF